MKKNKREVEREELRKWHESLKARDAIMDRERKALEAGKRALETREADLKERVWMLESKEADLRRERADLDKKTLELREREARVKKESEETKKDVDIGRAFTLLEKVKLEAELEVWHNKGRYCW